ncbi:serine/arginine-rich splicing factor 4/5/6 [Nematocida major]|uniref:serine/arginine-rich splicing factor 4/5/6 n=1 Tax=Nematocida major TaxID=1912982 RepID=UPI002007CC73|nr:serine/arginine-rich splicing factor 4/5/6 [Nematocida major]KAH9387342.1 serine/arginine-rich splicing factor 4/5/6 [Nematocida major]
MFMEMQLYIGGLKEPSHEKELESYFSKYGKILGIKLYSSYGFVTVEPEIGSKILSEPHEINGSKVVIEEARGQRKGPGRTIRGPIMARRKPSAKRVSRLILENLPKDPEWSELRSFVLMSGARPTYLKILPSGDGLLEFKNRYDRDIALEKLKDQEYHGNPLNVRFGRKRSEGLSMGEESPLPEEK